MGLIHSYAQPTANAPNFGGPIVVTGAPSAWQAIDDGFRPVTVRGTTGAGTIDEPADDSNHIGITDAFATPEFTFGTSTLYLNGEDVALQFHVRARTATPTTDKSLVVFWDPGDVVPDINELGTITVSGSGAWANYTITSSAHPTGTPWPNGIVQVFGVRVITTAAVAVQISRIYVTSLTFVGPTVGRDYRQSNWRFCDQCGFKTPYERTQRPVAPHPQAGLVVCTRCLDEPDHDTRKIMSKNLPRDIQDVLY